MFPPTPPVWTIVWPEGDEPPDIDENTDRYAEHATRQAAEAHVHRLLDTYEATDGAAGAHFANIRIFPPGSALSVEQFLHP